MTTQRDELGFFVGLGWALLFAAALRLGAAAVGWLAWPWWAA